MRENRLTPHDYEVLKELVREYIDHCLRYENSTDIREQKAFWRDLENSMIGLLNRFPKND